MDSVNLEEVLRFVDAVTFSKTSKHLKDIEVSILRGAWQGQSYEDIALELGYTDKYLKQDVGPKLWKLLSMVFAEKVSKTSFRSALERKYSDQNEEKNQGASTKVLPTHREAPVLIEACCDWSDAPNISAFYGRTEEIATLKQLILKDGCQLVAILGMGGMGKTTLALKLAQELQSHYEFIIWRSIRNAPELNELLSDMIQLFSGGQEKLPEKLDNQLSTLFKYLRNHRCLVILDNMESILQDGEHVGQYISGYEEYGNLLQRFAESNNQSCLIVTSREKTREITLLEGNTSKVYSLPLRGLLSKAGYQIFQARGNFFGISNEEWQEVFQHYAGNPLALKIVASAIQESSDGNMSELIPLLRRGELRFENINDLLERQFKRLGTVEKEIIYWLAINREPVSISQLSADIETEDTKNQLVDGLASLIKRSLVERSQNKRLLQPVVMEYVTEKLVQKISGGIATKDYSFLKNYALLKASSEDYVRQAQVRFILKPIINKLTSKLNGYIGVEHQLVNILNEVRQEAAFRHSYIGGNLLNLFIHLKTDLTSYDFSHFQIRQAYLQGINLHHVNFSGCNFQNSVFTKAFGAVKGVKFSPDGQILATTNTDCSISLWHVDTGQHILTCNGHTSWVSNVDFNIKNQTFLSASEDNKIKIWNLYGTCLNTIDAHTKTLRTATFSPNGELIASCGDDQLVKLWDVDTGKCLKVLDGHDGWVFSISFSPDGKLLASSSNDKSIRIWEVETGKCIQIIEGHRDWILNVNFSPDGQTFTSASFDHTIRVWKLNSGECLHILKGHTSWVWKAVFSPDGVQIASTGSDKTIKMWDVSSGKCTKTITGHTDQIWSLAYHPDGNKIATGSDDQTVRIWNITDGKCLKVIQGYTNWVKSVKFTPNSQQLVSAHQDHAIRVWHISGRQESTLKGHEGSVLSLAVHPNGEIIASGSEDHTIKIWDITDTKCLYTINEHTGDVWGVSFSPDGKLLASASYDRTIKIWQLENKVCIYTLKGYHDKIGAVTFNASGSLLATAGEGAIDVWDVEKGICLYTLEEEGHKGRVKSVAFSPDSQYLVSGSTDRTIKIWDLHKRWCIRNFTGHGASVVSVSLSSDGEKIISSACERTIRIWDINENNHSQELTGHKNWVWSATFSLDNQLIASASQDESIIIWDANTNKKLVVLRAKRPYEGMQISSSTGLTVAETSDLITLGAI